MKIQNNIKVIEGRLMKFNALNERRTGTVWGGEGDEWDYSATE